jgi:cytochrome c-type biogenesis protein CcmH
MTLFVLIAAAMTALAVVWLWHGLNANPSRSPSRRHANAQALRQLAAELEDQRARDLLSDADYRAARGDLERRALSDAALADTVPGIATHRRTTALLLAGVLPCAALLLYGAVGEPKALAEPERSAISAAELQDHMRRNPDDARGWILLARQQMDANRFGEAVASYERAIAVSPRKAARDPQVWCELADAVALAQGGKLAGRPAELIARALALDPAFPRALEMAGSAAIEARDYRAALGYWQPLLAQLEPDSTEHAQLSRALVRVNALAGTASAPTEP